jgi:type II secretory pathway pseudopilin PulG
MTQRGFTVCRLMVTIAIAGVLLAAATPNIASAMRVYSVRSAARQVYGELQNARMAALTENRGYTFTADAGGASYSVQPSGGPSATKPIEAAGVTIAAPNAIAFASNGSAATTATVTVTDSARTTLEVAVSPAGRVRIQ